MINDREIATLILLIASFMFCLAIPSIRKSLGGVVRAFVQSKIVTVMLSFLAYALLLVWFSAHIGLWDFKLIIDTILVMLAVGFPMLLGAAQAKDGTILVRKVIQATISSSAIIAFYINLVSLNIVGELLVQIVGTLVALLSLVAKHQGGKSLIVGRFMDGVLAVIGLSLLMFTTVNLVENWKDLDLKTTGLTLAMSIWLPLALLPFIYVISFYAATDTVFTMLLYSNERKKPNWKARLAVLIGFHANVRYAYNFTGEWRADVASLTSYRAAREVMKKYRSELGPKGCTQDR